MGVDPTDPPSRAPLAADLAARLAGLWILAGCLLKAWLGTPADLPEVVRSIPLALGTLFSLALGLEAFVGLATLLRPGRFWPAAALLLVAFLVVLLTQVAAGASSCGCFGATVPVPPWVMLAVDAALLVVLLLARPWRLARGGRPDLVVGVAALAVAVALPILFDRELKPGEPPTTRPGGLRPYLVAEVETWEGKRPADTDLGRFVDLTLARDGMWILFRESCEVCAECLRMIAALERGEREITLVRVPEKKTSAPPRHVHALPQGGFVHVIDLPDTVDWTIDTPSRLDVEGGVIRTARANLPPDACR